MNKTKFIAIRITPEQQKALRIAAAYRNMTFSQYVLLAVQEKIAKDSIYASN